MKVKIFAVLAITFFISFNTLAQVKVGRNPTSILADANFDIQAENNNRFYVRRSSGAVGIGTSGPAAWLHLHAAGPLAQNAGAESWVTRNSITNDSFDALTTVSRRHTAGGSWSGAHWRIRRSVDNAVDMMV
jgi:hypothetical protein